MNLRDWVVAAVDSNLKWAEEFGDYARHPSAVVDDARFGEVFAEFTDRLRHNYPYFHPRYAGQMLKPPHPAAVVGYLTAMLINPNNHDLDGGPATTAFEREVIDQLASMFGFDTHLGHLTSSGTIANLEALFVAREIHPAKGIAYSNQAHYTHGRMCGLLGIDGHAVATDARGRIDLDALEDLLQSGRVGTVVLTAGTTGIGAIDPIHEALRLCERYDVRIHVDASYGGFYTLLAGTDGPEALPPEPWQAIASADSVTVDPHKHGLQPYGCGAILFRDPSIGRFYLHDSPYTYFTSNELHLGEISLECSRAGASAAAIWLTLQLFPPTRSGLGEVLAASRRAALRLSDLLEESPLLTLYQRPELDIVCYFPTEASSALTTIDAASRLMLRDGMAGPDPVYLSHLRVGADEFTARHPAASRDADGARILRSVLMKPEAELHVEHLHSRLEYLAARWRSHSGAGARVRASRSLLSRRVADDVQVGDASLISVIRSPHGTEAFEPIEANEVCPDGAECVAPSA